jgi:hypothetical protein
MPSFADHVQATEQMFGSRLQKRHTLIQMPIYCGGGIVFQSVVALRLRVEAVIFYGLAVAIQEK